MPPAALPLILVMGLLLSAVLCVLAASGHFPPEHRAPALRSRSGTVILLGAPALSTFCLLLGIALVWGTVPWYAAVIGAGAAVLAAALLLRPLPDAFVNGRAALATCAGASLFLLALLLWA